MSGFKIEDYCMDEQLYITDRHLARPVACPVYWNIGQGQDYWTFLTSTPR